MTGLSDTVIVIPCYNESQRLDVETFERFILQVPDVTLLFVDDGSTDNTLQVLTALSDRNEGRVRTVSLPLNVGKAEAVRQGVCTGLELASSFVGYWDADLATPLDQVVVFRTRLESHEHLLAVFGSRVQLLGTHIDRKPVRHYAGRLFASFASLTLKVSVYDTQCGAKLFRVCDDVDAAFREPFIGRWVFDVEVLARIKKWRLEQERTPVQEVIVEQPLPVWRDQEGSTLSMAQAIVAFADLGRVWQRYR